jgi:hypothetical protein
MLNLRATPVDTNLPSPAEMLFGRRVRTPLPSHQYSHKPAEAYERLQEKSEKMKEDHDKHAGRGLPPLYEGQKVRVQSPDTKTWTPAEVSRKCDQPRSYELTAPSGSCLRRNRSQIREVRNTDGSNGKESKKKQTTKHVHFAPEPLSQPKAVQDQTDQHVTDKHQKPDQQQRTRSGRISRKPARFRSITW